MAKIATFWSKTRIGFLLGFALISWLVRYFASRGESNPKKDFRQLNKYKAKLALRHFKSISA